jgi:hypothetical protein
MTAFRLVALATMLALGGCVHPGSVQVSSDGAELNFNPSFSMPAGTTQRLSLAFSLMPDCSLMGVPVVRAVEEPAHGKLLITETEEFPNFPPGNPRSKCNTSRVKGMLVSYKPDPGYIGTDKFTYEMFINGRVIRNHMVGHVL